MDTKCELASWEGVHKASKALACKIRDSNYQPDIIIGLARGGWVPARNLCDFLGVKDLISLKVEHWGVTATPDGEAKLKYPVKANLNGKRVLIVDDCADSGDSLMLAKKYVTGLGPKEVKTATIRVFDSTPKDKLPDLWVEQTPWRWIIYPWNVTEDLVNLIDRLLAKYKKLNMEEIVDCMGRHFGVKVNKEVLKEVLEESERRLRVKRVGGSKTHWVKE